MEDGRPPSPGSQARCTQTVPGCEAGRRRVRVHYAQRSKALSSGQGGDERKRLRASRVGAVAWWVTVGCYLWVVIDNLDRTDKEVVAMLRFGMIVTSVYLAIAIAAWTWVKIASARAEVSLRRDVQNLRAIAGMLDVDEWDVVDAVAKVALAAKLNDAIRSVGAVKEALRDHA